MASPSRCVPGPLDTCTITARRPGTGGTVNDLQLDVARHPTGGLQEVCTGGSTGLAVDLRDGLTQVAAAPNIGATLGIDENGQLYAPLPDRNERTYASVAQTVAATGTVQFAANNVATLTNSGALTACWEISVHVQNAYVLQTGQDNIRALSLFVNGARFNLIGTGSSWGYHSGSVSQIVSVLAGNSLTIQTEWEVTTGGPAVTTAFDVGTGSVRVEWRPVSCTVAP